MWGLLVALLSGALMSVQGVFNTALNKTDELVGIHRMGADLSVSGLYCSLALYRKRQDNRPGKSGS